MSLTQVQQNIIDDSLEAPDSGDGDYVYPFEDDDEDIYCDVCGFHYDIENPCPFH